ncbi:MAG: 5-formyltetrahydrofolate cyclo-ligase [Arenimonas sp.]
MNSGSTINSDKQIGAEKKLLRQDFKAKRLAISAAQRMQTAEAIARQLLQLPEWQTANYVAGYWAMQGEVPLHVVQMRMQAPKVWCLPIIQSDKTLKFAPWRSGDDLVSNQYGIPEPDISPTSALDAGDLSIVLIPLLAYTRKGSRLGMGAGFYDRSFAFRNGQSAPPLLIGIAYSDQEAETLPSQEWDVKLDMLINEREVLRFENP